MPASEVPEPAAEPALKNGAAVGAAGDVSRELTRMEAAVESLLAGFEGMRNRALQAEENHRKLAEALRDTDVEAMAPTQLQTRLEELAEENRRLRAAVDEGCARAERIRSRLMLLEDEGR